MGSVVVFPLELEHKAHWKVRAFNFDLMSAGEKRLLEFNDIDEIRLDAYESNVLYKKKTKKWHDRRITSVSLKLLRK